MIRTISYDTLRIKIIGILYYILSGTKVRRTSYDIRIVLVDYFEKKKASL